MAAKSGHTLINILEAKPLYTDEYWREKIVWAQPTQAKIIPKNYVFLVLSGVFFSELFPYIHPTIKCLVFLGLLTASDSPEDF